MIDPDFQDNPMNEANSIHSPSPRSFGTRARGCVRAGRRAARACPGDPGIRSGATYNLADLVDWSLRRSSTFRRLRPSRRRARRGRTCPRARRLTRCSRNSSKITASIPSARPAVAVFRLRFVIDSSGIVITNNHVVGDANDIVVIFTDGRKLKAKVLGKDSKVDVAVLKVESDKPLKTVKFGDSDKMRVGDGVMAVGNPFGLGETVTAGIISARNRNIDSGPYDDFLQTDASINKGNSGGPLFNLEGEVIGINTAILSPSGGSIGIGFATPSASVIPVIAQLQEFHETRRGWLGVRIQPVDDTIADSLGLGAARGALVAGVDEKGPAKPAGLKPGDVIIKFDGKDIKESRDLPRLVASLPVGKPVEVVVVRDGAELTKTVTLGRLEDGEKQTASADEHDDVQQPDAVSKALGMEFSGLSDDMRKSFKIKDSVKGVIVTSVDPGSPAAERGLKPGDVIEEVNHQAVERPGDVARAIDGAKKDGGKKPALLLVSNGEGVVRFVAVPLD